MGDAKFFIQIRQTNISFRIHIYGYLLYVLLYVFYGNHKKLTQKQLEIKFFNEDLHSFSYHQP